MIWLTSFSILLVIFSQQYGAEGRSATSFWTNPRTVKPFMSCFMQNITASPAFSQQEKRYLESMAKTMISAMPSLNNGSSRAQIQAMDMAFASSHTELIAEDIMIAEDIGNERVDNEKASALNQVVQNCFMSTMGITKENFITVMKGLRTQEAMAIVNDVEDTDQYASTATVLGRNIDNATPGSVDRSLLTSALATSFAQANTFFLLMNE